MPRRTSVRWPLSARKYSISTKVKFNPAKDEQVFHFSSSATWKIFMACMADVIFSRSDFVSARQTMRNKSTLQGYSVVKLSRSKAVRLARFKCLSKSVNYRHTIDRIYWLAKKLYLVFKKNL